MTPRLLSALSPAMLLFAPLIGLTGCDLNPKQAAQEAAQRVGQQVERRVDRAVDQATARAVSTATGGAVQYKGGVWTVTVPEGQLAAGAAAPTPAGFPQVAFYPNGVRQFAGTTTPAGEVLPVSIVSVQTVDAPEAVIAFYPAPPPGYTADGPAATALAATDIPARIYRSADGSKTLAILAQRREGATRVLYISR